MMRIIKRQGDAGLIHLHLEGRLEAADLGELESAYNDACGPTGEPPLIDVAGVAFADAAIAEELHAWRSRGAVLVGCSGYLRELLTRCERCEPAAGTGAAGHDDAALLRRLRAGEDDAYAELVRRFGGRLLATARRMLENSADAEDALQEALLSAFRHIDQFNGQARLATWLHRIVVNAVLMRMRSRRARPEAPIETLLPRFAADGHWDEHLADGTESADVLLERGETRAMVRACIDRLPASYRTVVLLRDVEEFDTDEVAAVLCVTANAVKICLHRARQALRELLRDALAAVPPARAPVRASLPGG